MISYVKRLSHLMPAFVLLLLLAMFAALSHPAARTTFSMLGLGPTAGALAVTDLLNDPRSMIGNEAVDGTALRRFYALRDSDLAWSGNARASGNAAVAFAALAHADEQGLDASQFVRLAALCYEIGAPNGTDDELA
jgi:hypothetical protein